MSTSVQTRWGGEGVYPGMNGRVNSSNGSGRWNPTVFGQNSVCEAKEIGVSKLNSNKLTSLFHPREVPAL